MAAFLRRAFTLQRCPPAVCPAAVMPRRYLSYGAAYTHFDDPYHLGLTIESDTGLRVVHMAGEGLNALSPRAALLLNREYQRWLEDDQVHAIIWKTATPDYFSCGLDYQELLELTGKKDEEGKEGYLRSVLELTYQIAHCPKPQIALLDGFITAGAVGLFGLMAIKIVTQNSNIVMPETSMGLCPSMAAMHVLAQTSLPVAAWLSLTGAHIRGMDMLELGLATHYVRSEDLELLQFNISQCAFGRVQPTPVPRPGTMKNDFGVDITTAGYNFGATDWDLIKDQMEGYESKRVEALCMENMPDIEYCFSQGSVEDIMGALRQRNSEFSLDMLQRLQMFSPLALKVTLQHLQNEMKGASIEASLEADFRHTHRMLDTVDAAVGIRRFHEFEPPTGQWECGSLEQVDSAAVNKILS